MSSNPSHPLSKQSFMQQVFISACHSESQNSVTETTALSWTFLLGAVVSVT